MRIQILSDLHLEFGPLDWSNVDCDLVVFAGDVHTGLNGVKWIAAQVSDRPVWYVTGNHEFYGANFPALLD